MRQDLFSNDSPRRSITKHFYIYVQYFFFSFPQGSPIGRKNEIYNQLLKMLFLFSHCPSIGPHLHCGFQTSYLDVPAVIFTHREFIHPLLTDSISMQGHSFTCWLCSQYQYDFRPWRFTKAWKFDNSDVNYPVLDMACLITLGSEEAQQCVCFHLLVQEKSCLNQSLWLQSEYSKLVIVLSTVELYAFHGVGNGSSFLFLEFSSGDLCDLRLKVLLNSSGLGPPWDPLQA